MRTPVGAEGAVGWVPVRGITNNVMLCAGSVVLSAWAPETGTSASRAMVLAAVTCQASAVVPCAWFAMVIVVAAAAVVLLIRMTVSAPSPARSAAKAATVSGFGAAAATLV